MNNKKYCIFIISYKRAKICRDNTFNMLKSINCKASIYIVCSDDDPTIEEYYNIYGKENVLIFNKLDIQKRFNIDLCDCYYGENNRMQGTVWVRNACYELAEKLGFKYFLVLDDDYTSFNSRYIMYETQKNKEVLNFFYDIFKQISFDEFSSCMFDIIDSQPFIACTGFAHIADYIGGVNNFKKGLKFKVINVFFLTTEKRIRFVGRMNDDINTYLLNNNVGRLFLSLYDIFVQMLEVRKVKGGMLDLYKKFNSWMQGFYSVICSPSAVKLGMIGKLDKNNNRIRHKLKHDRFTPKIINNVYCKNSVIKQNVDYNIDKEKTYKINKLDVTVLSSINYLIDNNQSLDDMF